MVLVNPGLKLKEESQAPVIPFGLLVNTALCDLRLTDRETVLEWSTIPCETLSG
jgi:hypothetical protein